MRFMAAEVPTASRRRINPSSFLFVFGLEIVFADAAVRAGPIVGQLFERCSGGDVVFGIALFRIIHVAADFANVLLHDGHPLVLQWVAVSFRDSSSFEQMISLFNNIMMQQFFPNIAHFKGNFRLLTLSKEILHYLRDRQYRFMFDI